MRPDQFVALCICISEDYANETDEPLESKEEIEKRLKACQASDWINDDGKKLAENIKEFGIKKCLPDIAKAGMKVGLKIGLNAINAPKSVHKYFNEFIDNL